MKPITSTDQLDRSLPVFFLETHECDDGPTYQIDTPYLLGDENPASDGVRILHPDYNSFSRERGWFIYFASMKIIQKKPKKPVVKRNNLKFERLAIEEEVMESILATISQKQHENIIFTEWGFDEVLEKGKAISMLFFGKPGTGKTLAAEIIAQELGLKLKIVGPAQLESSSPGQTERNIEALFKEKGILLLFDECDSLIGDRSKMGMILAGQINTLLSSLERYEGVAIFTTNRIGHLDPAFERRLSAKVEFKMPNQELRQKIWKILIPKKTPLGKDVCFETLSQVEMSGGNIKNCVLQAARYAVHKKKKSITMECFQLAVEREVVGMRSFTTNNIPAPL